MTYGIDLRERVVSFVLGGGSKASASRQFKVSLWCVQDWCKRRQLEAQQHPGRKSKIDMGKLLRDVEVQGDALLRERANKFGVTEQAVWYALRRLQLTHKKNVPLSGKESS